MAMIPKVLIAIGVVILVLGIVIAIIPANVTKEFSASEFSVVGSEYVAPSVEIPAGVIVTVTWATDSWMLFGTPSCALAMKNSDGDYNVLASDEGKSGSFTYATTVQGDYYILQRGMTVFTAGTVTLSFTYFPGMILGIFLLIIGIVIASIGGVLNRRAKKVTVIYPQGPPMQPMQQPQMQMMPQQQMQYPAQYPPQPQQGIMAPPGQQYMAPPQPQYQAPPPMMGQPMQQPMAPQQLSNQLSPQPFVPPPPTPQPPLTPGPQQSVPPPPQS